jgi:hypothetical protein
MKDFKLPSNRNFGIIFSIFFFIISLWPLLNSNNIRIWALAISLIFLSLALLNSKLLTPLNRLWMKFGLIIGSIISPIVMGIIYFGVVTPTGFILRLFKKDVLNLKFNKDKTYWVKKDNSNNNMNNQF